MVSANEFKERKNQQSQHEPCHFSQAECIKWHQGFPGGSDGKESACNAGDWAPSLGWGDLLEKGEAPHSSVLAWRIPRTGRAEISEEARVHLFLRCLPASIAESSAPEGKGLSVTRLWML